MNPAWAIAVPIAELAVAAWMIYWIFWRRYRWLLLYLLYDSIANFVFLLAPPEQQAQALLLFQPLRVVLRFAVGAEVARISCIGLTDRQKWHAAGWALAISGYAVAKISQRLGIETIFQYGNLAAQFCYLVLATMLVVVAIYVSSRRLIENIEHASYRLLVTAMMVRIFLSSAFVKGGFAFLFLPYDIRIWRYADPISWAANLCLVLALGSFMTCSYSSRRPTLLKYAARA